MSVNTATVSKDIKLYRIRNPQYSPYYQCIEDNYETFERVYVEKYEAKYGLGHHFLKERMNYIREELKVIYKSKDGKNIRQFDATDFIAILASHIPNKSEQMFRYLGF